MDQLVRSDNLLAWGQPPFNQWIDLRSETFHEDFPDLADGLNLVMPSSIPMCPSLIATFAFGFIWLRGRISIAFCAFTVSARVDGNDFACLSDYLFPVLTVLVVCFGWFVHEVSMRPGMTGCLWNEVIW